MIFAPDGGADGGRAIRLVLEEGKTVPRERWTNSKMASSIYLGVVDGNTIYMPGQGRFYGYDLNSGTRLWAERGFDIASCLLADGKLLILDQNGKLTLATPTRDRLAIRLRSAKRSRARYS